MVRRAVQAVTFSRYDVLTGMSLWSAEFPIPVEEFQRLEVVVLGELHAAGVLS